MSGKSLVWAVVICIATCVHGFADESGDRLRLDASIAGLRQENLEQCLSTFHSDGPGLAAAEKYMRQLFPVVDFEYEVRRFTVVGIDGDCATARILQRTRLVGEPLIPVEHRSSTLDMIMVFRKHKSEWRIWTSVILESTVQ